MRAPGYPRRGRSCARRARSAVPVISELELAYRLSTAPFVAVTGTNGKTTTTALITHLLRQGGRDAASVGNIGVPAVAAAPAVAGDGIVVAECSSFQLALTLDFHPRVAVLLNITPDHIDWHGSLEAYAADKARIFANMGPGDVAVIDVDDPRRGGRGPSRSPTRSARGAGRAAGGDARVVDGMLVVDAGEGDVTLVRAEDLLIRGVHNVSNALAAAAAALAMGASRGRSARGCGRSSRSSTASSRSRRSAAWSTSTTRRRRTPTP